MAESISEGTLSQLLIKVGDRVVADEEIASIETDKIDVTVNAPEDGVVTEIFVQEGDVVVVGEDLAQLDTDVDSQGQGAQEPKRDEVEAAEKKPQPADASKQSPKDTPTSEGHQAFTTTPDRSVVASATDAVKTKASPPPEPTQAPVSAAPEVTPTSSARNEHTVKISRMRKTIASRLKQAQNICASLTTAQRVDMSALMAWRTKYKEEIAESRGVRLGYMGAFAKATSMAAQQVPEINASIDTDREIITYRDYVDISIAVSTPKGLVTPVVRNCEAKGLVQIEKEIGEMAAKARASKLTMADLEGGNFTISNPGIFGSLFGTPLINLPQAAVFNMNSIKDSVVAIDGKVEIRPMMYITMTYDHRLIDGREAITFLNLVKNYIEDPAKMLLD